MLFGCGPKSIFPDENLEATVRDAIGKTADEEIIVDEMANITELGAENRCITDITGLEYCINLTKLYLGLN
jgi:hypothetical protein